MVTPVTKVSDLVKVRKSLAVPLSSKSIYSVAALENLGYLLYETSI